MAVDGRALLLCAGGGLGDSLIASVVARALRTRFARVDALTLPAHRELLERVAEIDRVHVDDGGDMRAAAQVLQSYAYDACVVTWATSRTARLAQLAAIPIRVGQSRRLYSHRFTHQVAVRSERGDVTTHWSQILLDYARAIGCDASDSVPRVTPTSADEREAGALLESLGIAGAYAILHPANAVATERGLWPTGGWSALGRALRERFGMPLLVSGSAADAEIVAEIARDGGGIDIAGRTSIGAFAALAGRARFFAGITTGSMHVAAAAGAPTVGIFPFQTDTPERWGPTGERTATVRASYPCRPGERKETCPDYACVANLNVPRIVAAVETLLARNEVARRQESNPLA